MRKVTMIAGLVILGLLMVSAAQATVIAEHLGSNNPTTEGFTLTGGETATLVGDAGPPANWSITRGSTDANAFYSAAVTAADFDDLTGWTLTWKQKISAAGTRYSAGVSIWDGHNRINFIAGDTNVTPADAIYAFDDGTDTGVQVGTGKATDWHTWQVYMDPNGAGETDDAIEVYQDGTLVSTLDRTSFYPTTSSTHFQWGQLSMGSVITQQDAIVRLETGSHIIPEPSALVLVTLGLIGLLAYAWRRRK